MLLENSDSTYTVRWLGPGGRAAAAAVPRIFTLSATGLFLWLFLRVQWRIGDEGSIVYGALRVTQGAIPYRDFFEVMGPGSFYWLGLWFKAFGTSWLTSRVALLATGIVSASAIHYAATRHCLGKRAAFPAVLYTLVTLPLWPGTSHHFDSNMWVLLAFAVSVSPYQNRKASALIGMLAGFSSTIMPQKGVLLLAALCIARLIAGARSREWKPAVTHILWMVGPFLFVGAAVALFFWSHDALFDLVYANLIWPATRYHSVNVVPYAHNLRALALDRFVPVFASVVPWPMAGLFGAVTTIPFIFIAILPFVAVALLLFGAAAAKQRATRNTVLPLIYWCAGFALFAAECHRSDMFHLIYGSPILLTAVILTLERTDGLLAVTIRRTLVSCVVLLAAVLVLVGSMPATAMETRSGAIHRFGQDEALDFLHENVSTGEQVFVYPYYPMYYFLANVRNPTRYSILMYHINTPEQFDEVIRDLEAGQVRYVLWDTLVAGANLTRWFPGYQDPPYDEQLLERYLDNHYTVIGVKNGFRVLQRNPVG